MIESRLSAILNVEDIRLGYAGDSLNAAVSELLVPALWRGGVSGSDATSIVAAISEREHSASTISGPVALPHARHAGAPRILAALAINRSGALQHPGGIRVILAFVSPLAAAAEHLRFLAGAARLLRSPDALAALESADTPDDVLRLLREHGV